MKAGLRFVELAGLDGQLQVNEDEALPMKRVK